LERRARRGVLVRSREKIDHHFARTRDFAQTRGRLAMPRVIEHPVEQLEPAVQRGLRRFRILRRPAYRPADLTPDVAELLGERQSAPASDVAMLRLGHRRTTRPMNAAIAARMTGSSTPRDRLPKDGRRLIMELSVAFYSL